MSDKVRITLKKGRSFVIDITTDKKGNPITKRSQTMIGKLNKGSDGMLHLHRNCRGYYAIDPVNIKRITHLNE